MMEIMYESRLRFEQRLRPQPERIATARLQGCADRHAVWRVPTDDEIAAAVAELRSITTNPELLAETAGILLGAGRGQISEKRYLCAASYLIAAGADQDWVWFWAIVGWERAQAARKSPSQNWEPAAAAKTAHEAPLVRVRVVFAGLPMEPSAITHATLGLEWKITAMLGCETQRTGNGEEVRDWRYHLVVTGSLPGAPGETGSFGMLMEWMGDSWGIRPEQQDADTKPGSGR